MSHQSLQLLGIALCVLAAAFAAGAETALTALGEARSRQLIEKGHRSLALWVRHPERIIATLLILNTIANTLSAALMTAVISRLGASNAVAVATSAVSLLLLIFGEITPKALCRRYAVTLAPVLMPFISLAYWVTYPAVSALAVVPRWVDRMLQKDRAPVAEHGERADITSDEIEYMIDLGVKQGILDKEKSALLGRVLDFTDIVTREIMVPRLSVTALPVTATKEQVLQVIVESEHSRLPVYDGSVDNVVGILHVKTLLADLEMGRLTGPFDLRRYMREPFFVPGLMKISRLLREFQQRRLHLAVVVDEYGGTAGVVTLEDVVEEIVGEIRDEQDVEDARVKLLADGTVVADAGVALRELESALQIDFPDERDADTVGGFVTALAGRVPPPGSVVMWERLRFTVRDGDERHVSRVEVAAMRAGDSALVAEVSGASESGALEVAAGSGKVGGRS